MRQWDKFRGVIFLAIAALPLSGCIYEDAASDGVDPFPRLTLQQDNPQLALFDHMLHSYFSRDIGNSLTICAAQNDGRSEAALDAEDEIALMTRFPTLAPLSRCSLKDGAWTDADSGEPALVFTVHSFTCASSENCSGWAGYQAGATGSTSILYKMSWGETASIRGEWTFIQDPVLIAE